jgi:hypothetical protein
MIVILLALLLISYCAHYVMLQEERLFQAEATITYYEQELRSRLHERSIRTYAYHLGKKYLEQNQLSDNHCEYIIDEFSKPERLQFTQHDDQLIIERYNTSTGHYDHFYCMKYENNSYKMS